MLLKSYSTIFIDCELVIVKNNSILSRHDMSGKSKSKQKQCQNRHKSHNVVRYVDVYF